MRLTLALLAIITSFIYTDTAEARKSRAQLCDNPANQGRNFFRFRCPKVKKQTVAAESDPKPAHSDNRTTVAKDLTTQKLEAFDKVQQAMCARAGFAHFKNAPAACTIDSANARGWAVSHYNAFARSVAPELNDCRADANKFCKRHPFGNGMVACLKDNEEKLSQSCRDKLDGGKKAVFVVQDQCSNEIQSKCAEHVGKAPSAFEASVGLDPQSRCIAAKKSDIQNSSCVAAIDALLNSEEMKRYLNAPVTRAFTARAAR